MFANPFDPDRWLAVRPGDNLYLIDPVGKQATLLPLIEATPEITTPGAAGSTWPPTIRSVTVAYGHTRLRTIDFDPCSGEVRSIVPPIEGAPGACTHLLTQDEFFAWGRMDHAQRICDHFTRLALAPSRLQASELGRFARQVRAAAGAHSSRAEKTAHG